MAKTTLKNLAEEAIVLLHEMFGEGIEFECIEHFKTNEALTGIVLTSIARGLVTETRPNSELQ